MFPHHILSILQRRGSIRSGGDGSQTLHDVGNVDGDTTHVENEGCAIEEEVRLGGFEEFEKEAEEARADYDVQDAGDEGWGGMEESEVVFLEVEEGRTGIGVGEGWVEGWSGPEDVVVVREVSEEDSEEEADGWGWLGWVMVRMILSLLTTDNQEGRKRRGAFGGHFCGIVLVW